MTESTATQTPEETPEASQMYLENLFAKAGERDVRYLTDKERANYTRTTGAKKFKRKTLGICGSESVKSLDELAEVLLDLGMAQTPEDARKTVPKMVKAFANNATIEYDFGSHIDLKEVRGLQGDIKYRVSIWSSGDGF